MNEVKTLKIEVAYAKPDIQVILPITIMEDTTVSAAIQQSGILEQFPEINLEQNKVGVFGKLVKLDSTLRNRDRIEIYRPLIADPKESRRKRAAKKEQQEKSK